MSTFSKVRKQKANIASNSKYDNTDAMPAQVAPLLMHIIKYASTTVHVCLGEAAGSKLPTWLRDMGVHNCSLQDIEQHEGGDCILLIPLLILFAHSMLISTQDELSLSAPQPCLNMNSEQ